MPVPQAEIHLPRSWVAKPSRIFCDRQLLVGTQAVPDGLLQLELQPTGGACIQSMGDSAISASPIRCTGIAWFTSASSAFFDHRSVVEMMIRLAN